MNVDLNDICIDELRLPLLAEKKLTAFVLRLDKIHPQVSGNKWFKLKEYLADAKQKNRATILTFGGAFSNHILATAAACYKEGFTSIGIIRGEKPKQPSQTLLNAAELGMELIYTSREEYKWKKIPSSLSEKYPDVYVIPEGGYGVLGRKGAQDILFTQERYTHILAAVGTGTTLAGLVEASQNETAIIGISALKNHFDLTEEVNALVSERNKNRFQMIHDYSFGGYAKHTKNLLQFMNQWYQQTGILSDFVYTGKLFYAFIDLCAKDFFPTGSTILLIHSGGLQGNRSLPNGTLIF